MTDTVRWRLSLMFFLEYVAWGSWLPLLALYLTSFLGFTGTDVGWIFATQAIASVAAVFVSGQIADRYMSSERFLALSHVIAGLAMFALVYQKTFWTFFVLMLLYTLLYIPTLSLTNSTCFHHLKDPQNDFGKVRLWGTIGWIAASWPFVFILEGKQGPALETALTSIFWVSGLSSLVLAGVCMTLPKTPPAKNVEQKNAPLEAIRLLAKPTIAVLFFVTFLDALVHQCYFQWTSPYLSAIGVPENWIMPAMSIGQIAEIATMAFLGYFLKRLGWRTTMTIGVLGHAVRFFIYAVSDDRWLVVASNVVHGFCYAFFFAAVYIFVDEYFPKDARASAQGLFNFLILGLGPFVGSLLWGKLGDVFRTPAGGVDFSKLFLVPTAVGLVAAIVLYVGFKPAAPAPAQIKAA
ncbi:MAG TPA: MFS transporter [Vicinamibacteria bacterium]|nr:MFS transporter [Vicinamibacteria bacterium]